VVKESLAEILSKCTAKDGFSVSEIVISEATRGNVRLRGYEIPNSKATVWKIIIGS
jgi:hypothetical protein